MADGEIQGAVSFQSSNPIFLSVSLDKQVESHLNIRVPISAATLLAAYRAIFQEHLHFFTTQ